MPCLFNKCAFLSLSATLLLSSLQAQGFSDNSCIDFAVPCETVCQMPSTKRKHQFYIGPEIYHVHRNREGGTKQNGTIYGVRGGYDRIKRYHFYWGFDALYGKGTLDGKSGAGNKIKSTFTDTFAEGRFGYTFQQKCGYRLSLTPFGGVGYMSERNNFKRPSPIPAHFNIRSWYGVAGFLSQASPTDRFDIGINFKARFLYDPKCKVSHDPDSENSTQLINEKIHYRVELPLTYHYWECCDNFLISLVPFYEFRQYGKRVNYPFDFFGTKLNIYGATLKFIYNL